MISSIYTHIYTYILYRTQCIKNFKHFFSGGQSIQDECNRYMRQKRRMMDGEVTTTNAGSLKCKKIIHVVGPVYKGGRYQEEAALRKCIDRSFDECARLELNSIAIPPVSTGIFKYPVEDAAVTILEAINQRIEKGKFLPRLIILIDNQDESLQVYERELRKQFDVVATDSSFNASNDASQPSPTGLFIHRYDLHLALYIPLLIIQSCHKLAKHRLYI